MKTINEQLKELWSDFHYYAEAIYHGEDFRDEMDETKKKIAELEAQLQ